MALQKESATADLITHSDNSMLGRIRGIYTSFQERREALGLSNPGTVENIQKEVSRDVFLNNLSFSGLRADLTKVFAVAPLFQVSHALSMGSQALPPYAYAAIYGTPRVFLQSSVDNDNTFSGRFNWRWSNALVTKTSMQISGQGDMVSIENDYTGADFTASLKAINPSILDGGVTGMIMGSYMQSVTPHLSLGVDTFWNRPAMAYPPDLHVSYAARYKTPEWIATAQFLAAGSIETTYWRKLSEKVETGIHLNLQFAGVGPNGPMGGLKKDGTVTIGAKYDFRASSVRAQIDSNGKVGCLLEKHVAPTIRLTFSGEIDHKQSASKVGLAVSIEAADQEVMEQQEKVGPDTSPIPF